LGRDRGGGQDLADGSDQGGLGETESRGITFLGTPDHRLRRNGVVARQRGVDETLDFILKCRAEDRYFVARTAVGTTDGLKCERQLE